MDKTEEELTKLYAEVENNNNPNIMDIKEGFLKSTKWMIELRKRRDYVVNKIDEIGFAVTFFNIPIEGYRHYSTYVTYLVKGPLKIDENSEFEVVKCTRALDKILRALMDKNNQKLDFNTIAEKVLRYNFHTHELKEKINDNEGYYEVYINIYFYVKVFTKIPMEKHYFIIPTEDYGLIVVYSEKGKFYDGDGLYEIDLTDKKLIVFSLPDPKN